MCLSTCDVVFMQQFKETKQIVHKNRESNRVACYKEEEDAAEIPPHPLLCDNHTTLHMEMSLVCASTCYNTQTKITLTLLYCSCTEETAAGLSHRADVGCSGA